MLAQCIRATEAFGEVNIDGTCQIIQQAGQTRCETDDNPCTIGRCRPEPTEPTISLCDDGDGALSPCPMECIAAPGGGGNDEGQNCCLESTGCYGCTPPDTVCKPKGSDIPGKGVVSCVSGTCSGAGTGCAIDDDCPPNETCDVPADARATCRVDGSAVDYGRCCDPTNVLPGQYISLADCVIKGWQWLGLTDPDDKNHTPVRCPVYSSGIIEGKPTDDDGAVYPIVPPPSECDMKNTDSNYGAYCEEAADCAKRCQGDPDVVCVVPSDCVINQVDVGPCVTGDCVAVAGPGRCPGHYEIGDDYDLKVPPGKALRLQEIRFRGGGERQQEILMFDFYDKSVDPNNPVRTGSVRMRIRDGGIYTYTIERDCDPNCDASQFCPADPQCECQPRNDGCIADPPFIIPASGYMVMRSGREVFTVGGLGPDDLNGSWVPVVDPVANKGFNNPNWMWIDGGPSLSGDDVLPAGARVLAFELVGRIVNDPTGACCDPNTGDCTDTNQWECRFCSGTGANAGDVCDRGGANWHGLDRDCTEEGDECTTGNWRGPRTKSDYDEPWCHGGNDDGLSCDKDTNTCDTGLCYGGEKCVPDDPCSDGTCCDAEGNCSAGGPGDCVGNHCLKDPTMGCETDPDCELGPNDFGPCLPLFQGFGTLCDPNDANVSNCCPQPQDDWGECCRDEWRCTGGLHLPCDIADGAAACDNGNDGTCEMVCPGPTIFDIQVPDLIPPGLFNLVDLTTDSNRADFNSADTCAYQTNDGWYASWHTSECAVVTFNYCCTDPQLQLVSQIAVMGCPCDGPVVYIPPDPGQSGYGDACGNGHCCQDGNYSVQWTLRAGTYHYGTPAGTYCEQSANGCLNSLDCAPGEACKNFSQQLQAHIIVEPCLPAACCHDEWPCLQDSDCPFNPHNPTGQDCGVDGYCVDHCSWLSKFECQDGGGDWLGDLIPNPIADCACFGDSCPCDDGACCIAEGLCEDRDGTGITPEECDAEPEGDYHGGVRCADRPCATCEFNMIGSQIDNTRCQGDTGQYIFPSDRFQGTRRADDFKPQDSPIRTICFSFGYLTDESEECTDDPPEDDFHIHIYENNFGFPMTEVQPADMGPVVIDRKEPIPAMRTWQFHTKLDVPVEVDPGECYWLEITGMGDNDCMTLWTHSVDGNNYGLRDDNQDWTAADIRDNDVVWCIDPGIVVPTAPGTNGGCGDLPVACCTRDPKDPCYSATFNECSDVGNFGFPYSVCGTFECPDPPNDLCTTDPSGIGPPDGAAAVCLGDPKHPEWGEWTLWDGLTQDTRLGQCNAWPGSAGFGQVCDPLPPGQCREPTSAVCIPHQPEPGVFPESYECWFDGDNRLASTDGPVGGGACGSENAMQADVWYKITAPCRGRAVVTLCDGEWEYDGMLSVYGDGTPDLQCLGPGDGGNLNLLECNDDYCRGSGTVEGVHWDAVEGAIYVLRQAGWSANGELIDAGQGKWQAHVGFFCDPDTPFEMLKRPPNTEHHARKHRFISVDATTNLPKEVSIKIEIAEMMRCQNDLRRLCIDADDCPTVCTLDMDTFSCSGDSCGADGPCIDSGPCGPHPNVGLVWYAQQPQTRGVDCPNGYCDEEDWYSRVVPLAARAAPYSSTWGPGVDGECNGYGGVGQPDWNGGCTTLHIGDCEIVPGVTYYVYACDPLGDPCSDPLAVGTTRKPELMPHYGDVAGAVDAQNPCCFTEPDDFTSVIDFGAYLLTNQNWGTTADPQAHPTWIDLHGPGDGIPPQYIIMVTDLTMLLRAFVDIWPYENTIGGYAPGDCP